MDFQLKLKRLGDLNNAQLGSLGEAIFAQTIQRTSNTIVQNQHNAKVDFRVNGTPVDVKTTCRDIHKSTKSIQLWNGKRESGVLYAQVEFFADETRVSLEDELVATLTDEQVLAIWNNWSIKHNKLSNTGSQTSTMQQVKVISDDLVRFFSNHNWKNVRVLYRTCQLGFGKESPDNLLPSQREPDELTVFLSFRDSHIEPDNLFRIYAFPNDHADRLPLRTDVSLGKKVKVDLDRVPQEFVFSTLEDLKQHYS